MATVTPVLRTSKVNKQGLAPICLRISDTERSRFVSLKLRVRPKDWLEKDGRVSKRHRQADHINAKIRRAVEEVEDELYRMKAGGREPTADDLVGAARGKPGAGDFFAFADERVDEYRRRGQIPIANRYKSVLKKFRTFSGEPLPFDKVTPRLLEDFETYMIESLKNKQNTRASAFRAIRAVYNKAIRVGLAEQADYPFYQFKVVREKTVREKLSAAEVREIERLPLGEGSLIWHVRNYFLFAFYCAGARFRDVALMRWTNLRERDGEAVVSYRMSKTGGLAEVPVVPQVEAILAHYRDRERADPSGLVFPLLDGCDLSTPEALDRSAQRKNALVNKYLKKIAGQAGVTIPLSFHIARHSFADIMQKRGMGVLQISQLMVHSDLKETDRYLKSLRRNGLGEEMRRLFAEDSDAPVG